MLKVNGFEMTNFVKATTTSDLYDPVGSFQFTLGYRPKAKEGDRCEIYVNGQLELTGIVDLVDDSWDKKNHGYVVSGRTLVGILADSFLTSFSAPPNSLKAMVQKFLADVPYLKTCAVEYHKDCSISVPYHGLEIGATYFSVFNEYALSRGLIFWAKPDGTLVFGKAKDAGVPMFVVDTSTAEKGRLTKDISKLFSEVIVISDSGYETKKVVLKNPNVPFRKPFVASYNAEGGSITKQANMLMHQQKLAAYQIEYTVPGFSQSGKNWRVNELAKVDDEETGATGSFLIHRRVFDKDRTTGSTTKISLGLKVIEEPFKAVSRKGK